MRTNSIIKILLTDPDAVWRNKMACHNHERKVRHCLDKCTHSDFASTLRWANRCLDSARSNSLVKLARLTVSN
jgi:hypothetical protein